MWSGSSNRYKRDFMRAAAIFALSPGFVVEAKGSLELEKDISLFSQAVLKTAKNVRSKKPNNKCPELLLKSPIINLLNQQAGHGPNDYSFYSVNFDAKIMSCKDHYEMYCHLV